jgi:hypothetical protein
VARPRGPGHGPFRRRGFNSSREGQKQEVGGQQSRQQLRWHAMFVPPPALHSHQQQGSTQPEGGVGQLGQFVVAPSQVTDVAPTVHDELPAQLMKQPEPGQFCCAVQALASSISTVRSGSSPAEAAATAVGAEAQAGARNNGAPSPGGATSAATSGEATSRTSTRTRRTGVNMARTSLGAVFPTPSRVVRPPLGQGLEASEKKQENLTRR